MESLNLGFSQFTTILHPIMRFREYSDKMNSYLFGPTFLKLFHEDHFVDDPIYKLLRERAGNSIFDNPASKDPVSRTMQLLASFFLRSKRLPLWSLDNYKMLTNTGADEYKNEMQSSYLMQASEEIEADTLYSWFIHLYNSFHWQGGTVSTFSNTADQEKFYLSLPFWDTRIQEYLSAMPEDWGRSFRFLTLQNIH